MKYFRRHLNFKRSLNRKCGECLQHKINIISFLKSNYKYKRRGASCPARSQQRRQMRLRYQQQNQIHQLPAGERITSDDKQISKKLPFCENIKLDKFLRMFILIMQQATPQSKNNQNFSSGNTKSDYNTLATRLVAKLKAIYKTNKKAPENVVWEYNAANNRAYIDANKDGDRNVDINNITGTIIHQQHNYDKVSTITSTPIKCQRLNHHQIKTTNSPSSPSPSSSPSSPQSPAVSMKTTATATVCTLLSLPSIEKYEKCRWTAILRNYACDNPSIHQHQYHHNTKHIQQRHTDTLTASQVFDIDNCCSSSSATPDTTNMRTSILQSVDQYVSATWSRSYGLPCLLFTLFIAFTIGIRSTTAGACWQTVLENGKCSEIFSLNISKSECCGGNQEFAYTDREPTSVEYFFATAIGGGMECSPCLESCANVKCGVNKKCVKRKGRPKCVCAPECGAARRRRIQKENLIQQTQQHHSSLLVGNEDGDDYFQNVPSSNAFKIKLDKSQQSRDTRSLSSEIRNVNLGLENGKDAMISSDVTSPEERHRSKEHNKNQRKSIHIHTHHEHKNGQQHQLQHQHQYSHQPNNNNNNQEPKGSRRLLITANVEHTEKPTTRRLQIFSNVRTTQARRLNKKNKNDHHEEHLLTDYDAERNEDNNYNDAEDNAKEAKMKSTSIDNGKSGNKNNRNGDSKKLLNQSLSRHKLKTNAEQNTSSSSSDNKNRNKSRHDLKTTKKRQHSINNNTRIINPQQNEHHAENAPHHRHHNHNHQHHHQHHRHWQQQEHKYHSHRQQSPNHGRHKHNNKSERHKEQTIAIKKPKNNKDYNITNTSANTTTNNNRKTAVVDTATTTTTAKGKHLSNSEANIPAINASSTLMAPSVPATTSLHLSMQSTTIAATYNVSPPDTQTPHSTTSATSSSTPTTPINSIVLANDDAAADDHYRSRSQNHGSEIATSSLLSATSSSSSSSPSPSSSASSSLPSSSSLYAEMSAASARLSSESSVVTTMSAEGEGVSLHDHNHRTEIPKNSTYNNKFHNNNDDVRATLQSNLHKTQLKQQQEHQEQQQEQQQQEQPQQGQLQQAQPQLQHHYPTPLFDGISEQFDLIGFPNSKQQQQQQRITNEHNVRPINPVCGTDGRTYNTECQLRKRACRTDNPNLQIAYTGHCRTTCNSVKCLNGLTCVEDQYSMPHCIPCKIECPQDGDDVDASRAVCGADGKTYKSVCDINRMICKIGRSISVAYPGPCRGDEVTCDDINCGPKQVCLIDLLTHKPRCTSCRYKCSRKRRPSSSQLGESKICGFNNRSYNSWCEMRKDSCSTGFYIDVKYAGECH